MREHEIPVPSGSGAAPSGGPTMEHDVVAVLTWGEVQQKLLVVNDSAVTVYAGIDCEIEASTDAKAIPIGPGDVLVVGERRPHIFTSVSLLCASDLVSAGEGKNITILGWSL